MNIQWKVAPKGEPFTLAVGTMIAFGRQLKKEKNHGRTEWHTYPSRFQQGMIVGHRIVWEGRRYAGNEFDDPPELVPENFVRVYLVQNVLRPRTKPIHVLTSDVRPL